MTHTHLTTLTCSACATRFKSETWTMTNNLGGGDRDFLAHTMGDLNILLIEPAACPLCFYPQFTDDEAHPVSADLKRKIMDEGILRLPDGYSRPPHTRHLPPWVRHILWRQVQVLQGQDRVELAYADLRIAWVVRLSRDPFRRILDAVPERAIDKALPPIPRHSQNHADNVLAMVRQALVDLPSMPPSRQKVAAPLLGSLLRIHGETPLLLASLPQILAPLPPAKATRIEKALAESIALERQYQRAAIQGFKDVLRHEPLPAEPPRGEMLYLIAEISRRLEDYDTARTHYDAALADDTARDFVRQWATEQKALLPPRIEPRPQ